MLHRQIEEPGRASNEKKTINSRKAKSSEESPKPHATHIETITRLNRIKGQITGIEKMIRDERYCVDILVQFRAVSSAIVAAELEILKRHLEHCVRGALSSKNAANSNKKINELMQLISQRL